MLTGAMENNATALKYSAQEAIKFIANETERRLPIAGGGCNAAFDRADGLGKLGADGVDGQG